ncbi:cytoskeleton-associated protein 2-like isoform X2 [Ostrea edulis]|uniref:cytoskeleton-associated protein 2-like isoform X2 n=1 Tax=Ostrea edulis TaxID=37623 RepID=UPI0024AEE36B|nr:cytoskeleton-associated protein 2-like isoform X2 [Ostrea edulis]
MDKENSANVKKATEFLEKWKKFQVEKDQKRQPLTARSSTQDSDVPKKKAGKKIVTSRYLNHKAESIIKKQPTAPAKASNAQKRISILPETRGSGTPMRKKTQTPFKGNKKYTNVKSKVMTASCRKSEPGNRKSEPGAKQRSQIGTTKEPLMSTTKPVTATTNPANKKPETKSSVTKRKSSQIRKTNSASTSIGVKKTSAALSPMKGKTKQCQFKSGEHQAKQFSRRHSDMESRNAKVTRSILKRKSCLPSLSDERLPVENEALKTHGHNVRFTSPIGQKSENQAFRKTPLRLPHRSMRADLEEWLKKRGKTPSGFRHLRCFDATLSAKKRVRESCYNQDNGNEEFTKQPKSSVVLKLEEQFTLDESMSRGDPIGEDLESMLEECTTLYEAGCPLEDTMKWLNSIEDHITLARSSARFYICKAKILKSTNNLEEVLKVFEKAVQNCAQPAEELAKSLTQIITEISSERERKARLKSALVKEVEGGNVFNSSAVKYCVRQLTPYKHRQRQSNVSSDLLPSPCKVVTPVRRSTRRSLSGLPDQLHDKVPVYTALEDIPSPERKRTLFQSNPTLSWNLEDEL